MRRIGDRVGMRAASLYKHFPNKEALEAAVISVAFERQAEAFERAGRDLPALARAYRRFATATRISTGWPQSARSTGSCSSRGWRSARPRR